MILTTEGLHWQQNSFIESERIRTNQKQIQKSMPATMNFISTSNLITLFAAGLILAKYIINLNFQSNY